MLAGASTSASSPKALPPITKDDHLPAPPSTVIPILPTPPKITLDTLSDSLGDLSLPSDAFLSAPPSPMREALSPPAYSNTPPESPASTPMSSSLGLPSPSSEGRHKKTNPFVDLLETEKTYVDLLSGIIRKVASAWSRSNLPPAELDSMFRAVEVVFKANRSFANKLKELDPKQSSARAIGDVLMLWIDQLDSPYNNYCDHYVCGFDYWEPVTRNARLPSVLDNFSKSIPPPSSGPPEWTLDALFALPRSRIRYYQKLYNRLAKSSQPGKNADKLQEAVQKLATMLKKMDDRSNVSLPGSSKQEGSADANEGEAHSVHIRSSTEHSVSEETVKKSEESQRRSLEHSTRESGSSGQRSSRDTQPTSDPRSSTGTFASSMLELERRLSTDRCRDLFTLNPRAVRLSINSTTLPYTREVRCSEDVRINFTPKNGGDELVIPKGHIFLLTDLFLVCERMTPEERTENKSEYADMWLCFPPLAAKHLKIIARDENSFDIIVLKKETILVTVETPARRESMMSEFQSTVTLAASLPPPSKQAPPPLPSLNGLPTRSPSAPPTERRPGGPSETPMSPQSKSANVSPRTVSPPPDALQRMDLNLPREGDGPMQPGPPPYSAPRPGFPPLLPNGPSGFGPGPGQIGPGQFIPPMRPGSAGGRLPPHLNGMGPPRPPPQFGPGQIIPPPRGESVRSPPPLNGPTNGMPPSMGPPPLRNGSLSGGRPSMIVGPGGPGSFPLGGPPPPMGGFPPNIPPHNIPPQRLPPGAGLGPGLGGPPGPPGPMGPMHGPHNGLPGMAPIRTPSDPSHPMLRKSPSNRSLGSQHDHHPPPLPLSAPPVPNFPPGMGPNRLGPPGATHLRPLLPSAANARIVSQAPEFILEPSPPASPVEENAPSGPVESSIRATMKCKVFLKQQHAQWKALGTAKLTLFEQKPRKVKQLVVESDNKEKTMLISTIVLTDGVERVGKTGVAIELSDQGQRTGIVYMIQLRTEEAAGGLFTNLIAGSDRSGRN